MGSRVLIVDDSPILRRVVARALGMAGVELSAVYQAGNGVEALKLLAEYPIDLVFADVNMPEMSGIELVEQMSANGDLERISVVMVTSVRNSEHIEHLKRLGVRAYLTKPFKPEQLRDAIVPLLPEPSPS